MYQVKNELELTSKKILDLNKNLLDNYQDISLQIKSINAMEKEVKTIAYTISVMNSKDISELKADVALLKDEILKLTDTMRQFNNDLEFIVDQVRKI